MKLVIVEINAHHVVTEDRDGPKDRQGKFPRQDHFGRELHQGYMVGDIVGTKLCLLQRPEKKVTSGTN